MDSLQELDNFTRTRYGVACAWAARLVGQNRSEDVVQDALKHALEKLHQYDASKGPFEPWMRSVVRTSCLQELRKDRRKKPPVSFEDLGGVEIPDTADPIGAVLDMIDEGARFDSLMAAFQTLSRMDKDLMIDVYLLGVPPEEACIGMRCSADALRTRLQKLRVFIRGMLLPSEAVA